MPSWRNFERKKRFFVFVKADPLSLRVGDIVIPSDELDSNSHVPGRRYKVFERQYDCVKIIDLSTGDAVCPPGEDEPGAWYDRRFCLVERP